MAQIPEKYREIEELLGEPLAAFVKGRRDQGLSWRRIAIEVTNRTDVDVTGESLRIWHQGRAPVVGSAV